MQIDFLGVGANGYPVRGCLFGFVRGRSRVGLCLRAGTKRRNGKHTQLQAGRSRNKEIDRPSHVLGCFHSKRWAGTEPQFATVQASHGSNTYWAVFIQRDGLGQSLNLQPFKPHTDPTRTGLFSFKEMSWDRASICNRSSLTRIQHVLGCFHSKR